MSKLIQVLKWSTTALLLTQQCVNLVGPFQPIQLLGTNGTNGVFGLTALRGKKKLNRKLNASKEPVDAMNVSGTSQSGGKKKKSGMRIVDDNGGLYSVKRLADKIYGQSSIESLSTIYKYCSIV